MIVQNNSSKRLSQTGSALVYILIAIALLAALTASFMRPSSQQTTAQSSFNTVTELKSQIDFISSSIQECILTYPNGDRGPSGTGGLVGTLNIPYPINPTDTYFTPPSSNNNLEFIRCPGNPGNTNDHAKIFGGISGKFLPPPVNLFEDWQYYSGTDGVFFFTHTNKTDAFLQTAMAKLDDNFSECQTDVIDASTAEVELTSTAAVGDPKCPDESTCFRVWVIPRASAIYPGDTDGEEAPETGPPAYAGCPSDPAP